MSGTLFGQAIIGGVLVGGLYGLMALGLSLGWGLLRLVNISHFALAFLAAYLAYQLGTSYNVLPWWSAIAIAPAFFLLGVGMHWVFVRFKVAEMSSMLVTFGVAMLIESLIQWIWTADFRKFDSGYGNDALRLGPFFVPTLDLATFLVCMVLATGTWAWLRFTMVGKALRASAQDPAMAAAFGINHRDLAFLLAGLCAAYAGVAGIFLALTQTLAPSEISSWIGVIFAVVIIGGLGNALGALGAGILIGVTESVTMAAISPAWAPLVSFTLLLAILIGRPRWLS